MQTKLSVLAVCALLMTTGVLVAQEETHCAAVFTTDIAPGMTQSNGEWMTVSRNCSGNTSCDDYFDIECENEGDEVNVSFCTNGGGSNFDTGLSVWSMPATQEACNDDACEDFQASLDFIAPAGDVYRVRIGSESVDQAGSYTLAYRASSSCRIVGAVPVDLQSFDVEK